LGSTVRPDAARTVAASPVVMVPLRPSWLRVTNAPLEPGQVVRFSTPAVIGATSQVGSSLRAVVCVCPRHGSILGASSAGLRCPVSGERWAWDGRPVPAGSEPSLHVLIAAQRANGVEVLVRD
jgi:hypothetical protein